MSAAAPADAGTDAQDESTAEHGYFQAIEESFIGLRGAPLLLSPKDYQVAARWHRAGIPLDLIRTTLEEVFAKRRERGAKGTISSLAYCSRAVQEAWDEVRELTAPGHRREAEPMSVAPRLEALAAALPSTFHGREALAQEIHQLAGDAEAVEEHLRRLDEKLLAAAEEALEPEVRQELETAVTHILAGLAAQLGTTELDQARRRLFRQLLRQRTGLPLLSLFAPEAEAAGGE